MVARELYGKDCPVVMVAPEDWPLVTSAVRVSITLRARARLSSPLQKRDWLSARLLRVMKRQGDVSS